MLNTSNDSIQRQIFYFLEQEFYSLALASEDKKKDSQH